ncbi:MAG: hypothetical protein AB1Z55_01200 [Acidimicrobiia bacterium]
MSRDTNVVLLVGRLAGPVERRRHPMAGIDSARFEVSVRSPGPPRRVDVLPVVWWDPPPGFEDTAVGTVVQVAGGVRRRFWATEDGRTSRLDLVAGHVEPLAPRGRS